MPPVPPTTRYLPTGMLLTLMLMLMLWCPGRVRAYDGMEWNACVSVVLFFVCGWLVGGDYGGRPQKLLPGIQSIDACARLDLW